MPIEPTKIPQTAAPDAKRVREAVKQFVGQADRTNNLFVDVLLDLVERVESLERKERKIAA